ncbi:unnamed protein product [Caenorhabditis angaria]|uniref:C-type lectin domain-containing protein n=1 Tax=Caenorhabditis angaria TaxID=860376 RepID=A0A9P1I1H7_9PELO|nr:unnamed protein product [Caenorhabditis angaria]
MNAFILLFLLFAPTFQLNIRDESFLRFCGKVGSLTTTTGTNLDGVTCKVIWNIATNLDDVEQICKIKAPYPLKSFAVDSSNKAECTYENVYTCRPDYTQINGYCYRIMSDKLITYAEAGKLCDSQKIWLEISGKEVKSAIVDLFDEDLIRLFELYFEEMRSIWIQPKEDFNEIVEYKGDGPNYAIVYGMATFYSVGPNSLIKMPKNHRAQAMCFYRPEETPSSFGYKARKLGKYYYPILQRAALTAWRTLGAYNYWFQNQDKYFAINQCKNSMSAIAGNSEIDVFNPTKDNMQLLRENVEVKESFIKSYSPSYLCCYSVYHYRDYGNSYYSYHSRFLHFSKSYTTFNCESGTTLPEMTSVFYSFSGQSHGDHCKERYGTVLLYPEPVSGIDNLEVYNRQEAPLLCSIFHKDIKERKKCPNGWRKFGRASGRNVCHRLFLEEKIFDDAQKSCRSEGAELSTFTSQEEFDFLKSEVSKWIGLRKKSSCTVSQPTGECTKQNIVVWDSAGFEDYSQNVKELFGKLWPAHEPNNEKDNEYCVHLRGKTLLLNDYKCAVTEAYSCVKDADYE